MPSSPAAVCVSTTWQRLQREKERWACASKQTFRDRVPHDGLRQSSSVPGDRLTLLSRGIYQEKPRVDINRVATNVVLILSSSSVSRMTGLAFLLLLDNNFQFPDTGPGFPYFSVAFHAPLDANNWYRIEFPSRRIALFIYLFSSTLNCV